jgi:hypothetical protein
MCPPSIDRSFSGLLPSRLSGHQSPLENIGLIVAKTKAQKSGDGDSFFKETSKFN